jgi:hypothetical protein
MVYKHGLVSRWFSFDYPVTLREGRGELKVNIMADSPMMAMVMGVFGNPALAGASGGKLKRIGGHQVIATPDGEIQSVVHHRFMIQISGSATMEDKEAYFEAIDFNALQSF